MTDSEAGKRVEKMSWRRVLKDFAYYAALPDSMTNDELNAEFLELLGQFESQNMGSAEFTSSLLELSDRQWHSYRVLSLCLRTRIEHCLMSVWNGRDQRLAENVIGIMVRLGLEGIYTFLRSCSPKDMSANVFEEISLSLSELGDSVSDPYSGMR